MENSFMKYCGGDCEPYDYRVRKGCLGCQEAKGKLFWGECVVATCCIARGHDHCGQCQEFPCTALIECTQDDHG